MKDNFFFQNYNSYISYEENGEEKDDDDNSFYNINPNNLLQKQESDNYLKDIVQVNEDEDGNTPSSYIKEEYNNNEEYYGNNNFENPYKNPFLSEIDNNLDLGKDFPILVPKHNKEEEDENDFKSLNIPKKEKEEIISKDRKDCKECKECKDMDSSGLYSGGSACESTPLSTGGGTGDKNQSKDSSFINNNNLNNSNNNCINSNIININNNIIYNKVNGEPQKKEVLSKKRKQRIHLEDLNIDPEIIKYKKYQTIGDKVITSKNTIITPSEKKEIRAIRNRISAQKSRDRKKAEFLNLQNQVQYLQAHIKKQNLMLQNYYNISCYSCKSKINEINKRILDNTGVNIDNNNDFNIKDNMPFDFYEQQNEQDEQQNQKEYLELEENNSVFQDKKFSLLGKIPGALIALVCLIGIVFCVFEGGFILSNKYYKNNNNSSFKSGVKSNIRHLLSSTQDLYENENKDGNINNMLIKEEDNIDLDKNVPLPIKSTFENNLNRLQTYHDKLGFDIYSFLKNKKNKKKGFLMKKQFSNDSISDNSMCIETNAIEHNNYIIDNDFKNTLPVEANNIVLDNNISRKIISLFVKDYDTLKRFIDGKSLSLQEQIEIEAKNSEDGCVYLQMIIPKYKIDNNNYGNNETYSENDFFEIRCKIFAYNNYYDSKVSTTY